MNLVVGFVLGGAFVYCVMWLRYNVGKKQEPTWTERVSDTGL